MYFLCLQANESLLDFDVVLLKNGLKEKLPLLKFTLTSGTQLSFFLLIFVCLADVANVEKAQFTQIAKIMPHRHFFIKLNNDTKLFPSSSSKQGQLTELQFGPIFRRLRQSL